MKIKCFCYLSFFRFTLQFLSSFLVFVHGLGETTLDRLVEELIVVDDVFFSSLWYLFLSLCFLVIALDERCSPEKFDILEQTQVSLAEWELHTCVFLCHSQQCI